MRAASTCRSGPPLSSGPGALAPQAALSAALHPPLRREADARARARALSRCLSVALCPASRLMMDGLRLRLLLLRALAPWAAPADPHDLTKTHTVSWRPKISGV
eukprot:scaffold630_cov399-Prasinococcus_capsulatus_cf.AAC.23